MPSNRAARKCPTAQAVFARPPAPRRLPDPGRVRRFDARAGAAMGDWRYCGRVDYDTAIIGAGVIGLACAEALARTRPGRSVVVLETARAFGTATSSRSSQVVHAGLYYPPGSLKARLCVAGSRSLYALCARRGIAHRRTGKLIVATCDADEGALLALRARAAENGVPDLTLLTGEAVRALEPRVRARCALLSPGTGILDSHGLMASLAAGAADGGCDFAYRHRVVRAEPRAPGYELTLKDPAGAALSIRARTVVNAAGLHADEIAALPGIDVDAAGYRQRFVKGSYFRLRPRGICSRLVYPVPAPRLTGLGVHLTVELDGGLRLGPDVEPLPGRALDYAVDAGAAGRFLSAASAYLDGLGEGDLVPDQAGIRPRLGDPAGGGGVPDFLIREESARGLPGWINLLGIESPGLTCSLEIAAHVAGLL